MSDLISRQNLLSNLRRFAPEHFNALVNDLILKEPSIDAVPRWIPCVKELPKEQEEVLVSIKSNGVCVGYLDSNYIDGEWEHEWVVGEEWYGEDEFCLVEAWMPLPEPYKVERKEE